MEFWLYYHPVNMPELGLNWLDFACIGPILA